MCYERTIYHLELRTVEGADIEVFESLAPFPSFVPKQQFDLINLSPMIHWVWHSVLQLGVTADHRELYIRTIVWLGRTPPSDQDLAQYDVRAFLDRHEAESRKRPN